MLFHQIKKTAPAKAGTELFRICRYKHLQASPR